MEDQTVRNHNEMDYYLGLACQKIEVENKTLHAFLAEKDRRKRIIREAANINKALPLYGLTVGVKDVFRVDGLPTKAGSKLPSKEFEGPEASAVTKLKQNGAIILGKTVTTEFAGAHEPGPTVNPINPLYTPGGSSSGSAAAVAKGLCDMALGTQTVGSTIRPAAFCGITGFKCSFGRIDTTGIINFAPSLDTVGLFTKHVKDLILPVKILFKKWTPAEAKQKVRLGLPMGNYLKQADTSVIQVFKKTIKLLADKGYTVVPLTMFDNIESINEDIWTVASYEMAQVHKKWFASYKNLYRPKTRQLIENGEKITDSQFKNSKKNHLLLREYLESVMRQNKINFWVAPSATTFPPMGLSFTGSPVMSIPWMSCGLPALTVPVKHSPFPLGLQLNAGPFDDEALLLESQNIERIVSG